MKKILFLLVLFSSSVLATEDILLYVQAKCLTSSNMRAHMEKYKEVAYIKGVGIMRVINSSGEVLDGPHILRIYMNPKTYDYTIMAEFPTEDIHCIVAIGEEMVPNSHTNYKEFI